MNKIRTFNGENPYFNTRALRTPPRGRVAFGGSVIGPTV